MSTQLEGNGSFVTSAAISAFRGVTLGTDRRVAASATAVLPLGYTQQDADSGDAVSVKFFNGPGTIRVSVTGCPVTAGDAVFAGAAGQVVRTGGTVTVGRALESASVDGTIIEIAPLR